MILKNIRIFPMDRPPIERGYVAFEDGKITALGPAEDCPAGEGLDLSGAYLYPGLIDAHCHVGMFGDSVGAEGRDGNESTDPLTPHLRAIDSIDPLDRCFQEAREAGVTTVLTGPGSVNAIGGQFAAVKTAGRWVDEMILKAPAAMKFALGENPKSAYKGQGRSPATRMAIAALIREELTKAREYLHRRERGESPAFDARLEALVPVVQGKLPAHFHAHKANDIATAVRIAKEFCLDAVIVHATEGHLIPELLAESGYPVITGPIINDRSKPELAGQVTENAALLRKAGIPVAVCTDHPENPIQYLPLAAALTVRAGLDREEALRAITIDAAKIAGIADRVGSITVGKDADLVVADGDILELGTAVERVWIDGKQVK